MITSPTVNWQLEQLIKLQRTRPDLVQRALQEILVADDELRWSLVISAYLDEEISLGKAAELLDIHPVELRKLFLAKGIPLYLGPVTQEEAQAEVDALRANFAYLDDTPNSFIELPGMREEYLDLLKRAGINSISALSQYTPERLSQILFDVNSRDKLVTKLPSIDTINSWITRSKAITKASSVVEE